MAHVHIEAPKQHGKVTESFCCPCLLQGSVGEYVSKVYQYDPPGSVYKVADLIQRYNTCMWLLLHAHACCQA